MDKPHKKLNAWKLAMDIVEVIYSVTKTFPAEEKFGLVSQMRRSAVSIPSNIAEGAGRNTKKDLFTFCTFLRDHSVSWTPRLSWHSVCNIYENTWEKIDGMLIEEDKIISGLIRSQKEVD